MLTGKIWESKSGEPALRGYWAARCDLLGAWTQGKGRKAALNALRSLVELQVKDAVPSATDFRATVTEIGKDVDGRARVLIEGSDPAALTARVLKYQRGVHGLTVAEVAARLGSAHPNSYSAYERGEREPSLSKCRELLGAVAPELAVSLVVEPRKPARPATKPPARSSRSSAKKRKAS
jgi:hypothetical protein